MSVVDYSPHLCSHLELLEGILGGLPVGRGLDVRLEEHLLRLLGTGQSSGLTQGTPEGEGRGEMEYLEKEVGGRNLGEEGRRWLGRGRHRFRRLSV